MSHMINLAGWRSGSGDRPRPSHFHFLNEKQKQEVDPEVRRCDFLPQPRLVGELMRKTMTSSGHWSHDEVEVVGENIVNYYY